MIIWLFACSTWLPADEPSVRSAVPTVEVDDGLLTARASWQPYSSPPTAAGGLPAFEELDAHPLGLQGAIYEIMDPRSPWRAEAVRRAEADDQWWSLLGPSLDDDEACRAELPPDVAAVERHRCPSQHAEGSPDALRDDLLLASDLALRLARGRPDEPTQQAIRDCARSDVTGAAMVCARALATFDRAEAAALAARQQTAWADYGLTALSNELAAYPTDAATRAALIEAGFAVGAGKGVAVDQLDHHQRVVQFHHDAAAADLSRALEALDLREGTTVSGYSGTLHALSVWRDGERSRWLGDPSYGSDLEQVVAFANHLAERAERDERLLLIEDEAWGQVAIRGEPDALRALIDAELVTPTPRVERVPPFRDEPPSVAP